MSSDERVMIFIDGSNLFHSAKDLGIRIDYEKIKKFLAGNRKLIRPYIFVSKKVPEEGKQINFYNKLRYLGYEVVEHELKQHGNNKPYEKGAGFDHSTASVMKKTADKFIELDDHIDEIKRD